MATFNQWKDQDIILVVIDSQRPTVEILWTKGIYKHLLGKEPNLQGVKNNVWDMT